MIRRLALRYLVRWFLADSVKLPFKLGKTTHCFQYLGEHWAVSVARNDK